MAFDSNKTTVGHLDSAVLYALLRLRGEAKALKLEKKASMKRLS